MTSFLTLPTSTTTSCPSFTAVDTSVTWQTEDTVGSLSSQSVRHTLSSDTSAPATTTYPQDQVYHLWGSKQTLKLKICTRCWFRFPDILLFCRNTFPCSILYTLWLKYCKNYTDFFSFKLVLTETPTWELWMEWSTTLTGSGSSSSLYPTTRPSRVRSGLNRPRTVKVRTIPTFEVLWWYSPHTHTNVITKHCKYTLTWLLNMYYNRYTNTKNDTLS